ncbi:laccase-21 [Phtheirospermum japonicum]|uniref:Laccase-21 n=1 Tax=Phtheirospermum japonicum TaxID=374723 RepID=A0A830CFJ8_9LAMI|nr:laccase-21 [Phtheirospermum japonicum]
MLTIKGQFPGPTIYSRRGDLVIVDVYNRAGHNITIHCTNIYLYIFYFHSFPV